jgi:antitoxin HicB
MRNLNWNRESVDRLFRIDHASKLDQIEAAFAAPGERLNFRVENAA